MRNVILMAGAVLIAIGAATAQEPEHIRPRVITTIVEPPPPPPPFPSAGRSPLAVTERLVSFDANKDHRITRDELPDRMQELIARGDENGDGALDLDEIRALVNAASSQRVRVAFRPPRFEGWPGVINDLRLSPEKRERALALLRAHTPPPNVNEAASSDLYKAMKSLLDDEEYENFVAAATRLSRAVPGGLGVRSAGGVVGGVVTR